MWGFIAVGTGLVLAAAGGYLMWGDTAFLGVARVSLRMSVIPQARAADDSKIKLSSALLLTECEVIGSESVLRGVVEPPPLGAGWGRRLKESATSPVPDAVKAVRDRMDVRPAGEAKHIEIRVFDPQPAEAAGLANDIAEAYRAFRREHQWPAHVSSRETLQESLTQTDRQAARMQEDLERLRQTLQVVDSPGTTGGVSASQTLESLRRSTQAKLEAQAELVPQEALLAKLKGLSHDDLLKALPVLLPDKLFDDLSRSAIAADQKLADARRNYGPDHPEVQKAKGTLEALQARLDERAKGLVAALEVKVSGLKVALQKQTKDIERIEADDLERGNRNAPYRELKRDLEDTLQKRAILAAKLTSTPAETKESSHLEVEIMDHAVAAGRPVSKRPSLAWLLMALGLALNLAGIGMVRTRSEGGLIPH